MATSQFLALEVPIDELVPSPINVRRDVGDVSELADSVREQGILEPLVVRPTVNGKYEVIIGSRRLAASKIVGLSLVPVIVQDISDADAIVRSLVENLQRGDLPLEDRVEAYKSLQQMDADRFSTRGLARLTGKAQPKIVQDFDAYETLIQLRPRGIQVKSHLLPSAQERRSGEAIPEYHATLLQQAMLAVRGQLPEEKAEETQTELARTIAPLEQDRARRVLDYFKMYPDRPVAEIASMALATVERSVILPASTARQLEEIAEQEGQGDWSNAITRLIERSPVATQAALTTDTESQRPQFGVQSELPVYTEGDEATAELDNEKQTRQPYRPLELPEQPASVQAKNKVIWNLTHYALHTDFYTIGYAGRDIEQFVEILKAAGVSTVVDVRHAPVSQYKPDFSRDNLRAHLEERGFQYFHRGELGVPHAIRERAVGNTDREELWRWYDEEVVPTIGTGGLDGFKEEGQLVAFMCAETDPTSCHRHRLFLALESAGFRGFDL